MVKHFLTYLFFLMIVFCQAQIHPQQTQYMFNAIGINPGAAGQHQALNATINHRTMWRGIEGAPTTDYVTVHTPLKRENIAVGMQFYHDKIGVTSRSTIMLNGAYRLPLGKGHLGFGLMAGITSGVNEWSQVKTTEDDDVVFNSGDNNYLIPSTGAGVYYQDQKAFAGISIPQLLSAKYAGGGTYKASASMENFTYHIMAGKQFRLNDNFTLSASTLVKYQKNLTIQPDITVLGGYQGLYDAGFTYRPGDAISFIGRGKINPQLRLSYSYDYNIHALAGYSSGSHELGLSYTFIYKTKSRDPRMM